MVYTVLLISGCILAAILTYKADIKQMMEDKEIANVYDDCIHRADFRAVTHRNGGKSRK